MNNRQDVDRLAVHLQGGDAGLDQVAAVLQSPVQILAKIMEGLDPVLLQTLDRKKRDQTDQRADAELMKAAIGIGEHVVEKTVFLIPKLVAAAAAITHGGADVQIVFEEFKGQALIGFVFFG